MKGGGGNSAPLRIFEHIKTLTTNKMSLLRGSHHEEISHYLFLPCDQILTLDFRRCIHFLCLSNKNFTDNRTTPTQKGNIN